MRKIYESLRDNDALMWVLTTPHPMKVCSGTLQLQALIGILEIPAKMNVQEKA
jgi:hypothetical protein